MLKSASLFLVKTSKTEYVYGNSHPCPLPIFSPLRRWNFATMHATIIIYPNSTSSYQGNTLNNLQTLKWIILDLDHGWPLVKKQGKSGVYVVLLINRRASEHCWVVSNLVAYSFLFTVFDKLVSLFMARCWFVTITLNLKTINEVWTTSAEIAHILLWQNEPRNLHHPNQLWMGKTFVFITTNQVVWPTIPNVS